MYYEISNSGVYSESVISTTSINNVTYYYFGTLTSGSTVLYDNNALDDIAGAATYADVNADMYYEISNSGVYSESVINTTGSYYHLGAFAVGTILYTNNNLTTLASSLTDSNLGDINSDTFNDLVTTDAAGAITQITYGTE